MCDCVCICVDVCVDVCVCCVCALCACTCWFVVVVVGVCGMVRFFGNACFLVAMAFLMLIESFQRLLERSGVCGWVGSWMGVYVCVCLHLRARTCCL